MSSNKQPWLNYNRPHLRGQAMVEFALILPLLLIIAYVFIQMAILFNTNLTINHLAREGARYAAVHPTTDSAITSYIQSIKPPQINWSRLTISITPAQGSAQRITGYGITVALTYNISSQLFLPQSFLGVNIPTSLPQVRATMVIE